MQTENQVNHKEMMPKREATGEREREATGEPSLDTAASPSQTSKGHDSEATEWTPLCSPGCPVTVTRAQGLPGHQQSDLTQSPLCLGGAILRN